MMKLPVILAPQTLQTSQQPLFEKLLQQGHSKILAEIYLKRGIFQADELDYQLKNLPHPYGLKDAEKAAQILTDALIAEKKILIIADYDCDGATSCAVAILGLKAFAKALGKKIYIDFIVPNRFIHGYGLTPEIIELAKNQPSAGLENQQPDLIITVDNGISSVDGVKAAKDLGWQVLITDHHLTSKTLPAADAIVNPNRLDCTFESKAIAGVGVIFYVLIALRLYLKDQKYLTAEQCPKLDHLLDLVALGTVADVARLDHLNRIFVEHGLKHLKLGQQYPFHNFGIQALLAVAQKNHERLKAQDFGFVMGPRLNAAGRLDDMRTGILCLLAPDFETALDYANALDGMNQERKKIEFNMKQDVDIDIQKLGASICLYQSDWHQGVIGILASRVKEKYHRPTLVFADNSPEDDGLIKASGRSIQGFHLKDAIDLVVKKHPDIITKFGGHAMAAGLTMHRAHFELFCQVFEDIAAAQLSSAQLEKKIQTDICLSALDHETALIDQIQQGIWGQGFAPPIFYQEGILQDIQILKNQHSKLKINIDEHVFEALWFGVAIHQIKPIESWLGQKIKLAYELDQNIWQNQKRIQLIVQGLEAA
jgi:single-stranded-DNA-specific exonuclease